MTTKETLNEAFEAFNHKQRASKISDEDNTYIDTIAERVAAKLQPPKEKETDTGSNENGEPDPKDKAAPKSKDTAPKDTHPFFRKWGE